MQLSQISRASAQVQAVTQSQPIRREAQNPSFRGGNAQNAMDALRRETSQAPSQENSFLAKTVSSVAEFFKTRMPEGSKVNPISPTKGYDEVPIGIGSAVGINFDTIV